jgi:Putative zinc-finger
MRPGAMTRARQCGQVRTALGVYVVGAIAPAERSAVDSHLPSCQGCRDELAALAGLPALLGRVPADEATTLLLEGGGGQAAPQPLLQSLLGQASRARRYRLWPRLAAAAAAGLIAGGGLVAASRALDHPQGQPPAGAQQWIPAVRGINPRTHAIATITYRGRPWGVQLDVQVSGIPAGTRCELQVTDTRGKDVASGSWTVSSSHRGAWYAASSSVPLASVRGFVITAGTQRLVSVPLR